MKNTLLALSLLICGISFSQEEELIAPKVDVPTPIAEDSIYTMMDEPAQFPGGTSAMMNFLAKNMRYPESVAEKGLQGKCFLKFVVDKEGLITDIKVLRGISGCPECDKEAIRVVKSMPKWIPGKLNGKKVKSYFTLPITFVLG